jgi:hypothetical protein
MHHGVNMNSKVKHNRESATWIMIVALMLITSCKSAVNTDTEQLILNMRNGDVKWSGNFLGLMPTSFSPTISTLQNVKEPIEPLLVDAMLDKDRYIAAHFLLTFRLEDHFNFSAEKWNGLRVQLSADGTASFEGNDLDKLHQYWIERLKGSKE